MDQFKIYWTDENGDDKEILTNGFDNLITIMHMFRDSGDTFTSIVNVGIAKDKRAKDKRDKDILLRAHAIAYFTPHN
jgi:hypothetical protein